VRLPLISPSELDPEQRPLYADMVGEIRRNYVGFKAIDDAGALLGPFNAWIRAPKWGRPIWDMLKAVATLSTLPPAVREVAILVTGAHFRAAYETYAHVILAGRRGLDNDKISTIIAGERPINLTGDEAVAYDAASALVTGEVLPDLSYRKMVDAFGEQGAMELIYLVGSYCFVSVTLNGFDVPVPDSA
jgi:4-carboxymuconolactone decarboxylase